MWPGPTGRPSISTAAVSTSIWAIRPTGRHHAAVTYDGATARLYADGMEVASAAKKWNLPLSRAHIGQQVNNFSEFWAGAVDEVRLYNRALSADEIAWLAGRTGLMHKSF